MEVVELETDRLKLRKWKAEDFDPFARMSADPEVMEYFPGVLDRKKSDALVNKTVELMLKRGWGLWAVEELKTENFMGFVGLHKPTYDLPFTPCTEIGWRLSRPYWGKGYATEASKIALDFAFNTLHLNKVYSFTTVNNLRSRSVMERIGMTNTNENFEHPAIPVGHKLREHVLYKITREMWNNLKA